MLTYLEIPSHEYFSQRFFFPPLATLRVWIPRFLFPPWLVTDLDLPDWVCKLFFGTTTLKTQSSPIYIKIFPLVSLSIGHSNTEDTSLSSRHFYDFFRHGRCPDTAGLTFPICNVYSLVMIGSLIHSIPFRHNWFTLLYDSWLVYSRVIVGVEHANISCQTCVGACPNHPYPYYIFYPIHSIPCVIALSLW